MPRKIDHTTRLSIAKKLRDGVHPSVLAHEYGVSKRTIYRSAQLVREIRKETNGRTRTVVCRMSPKELAAFDAKLAEYGIRSRSEGLRNVARNTNGVAVPDAELRDALLGFRTALNRCGSNVVQIAKRLNEARNQGYPPVVTDEDLTAVRHLGAMILDFADEIWLLAEGRQKNIELKISEELRRMASLGGQGGPSDIPDDPPEPFDEELGPLFQGR